MMNEDLAWGIDLGGTKIECAVLDTKAQQSVVERKRLPTEQEGGYEHILSQIHSLVQAAEKTTGRKCLSLGLGTPGTIDKTRGAIKNSNTLCLNGQSIQQDLSRLLSVPVSIANDANCFALAEYTMGVIPERCPDAEVVFGVILGTGVGGGLVVNNKIINGLHGIGGEWGHNYLAEGGEVCYCGKRACVETLISGPALERFYQQKTGNKRNLKEIYRLYREAQEPAAVATVERLIFYFGKAISWVINIIDPQAIVLGGGLSNITELYEEPASYLLEHVFNNTVNTMILPPKLGDSAGVFGAAMLSRSH